MEERNKKRFESLHKTQRYKGNIKFAIKSKDIALWHDRIRLVVLFIYPFVSPKEDYVALRS